MQMVEKVSEVQQKTFPYYLKKIAKARVVNLRSSALIYLLFLKQRQTPLRNRAQERFTWKKEKQSGS